MTSRNLPSIKERSKIAIPTHVVSTARDLLAIFAPKASRMANSWLKTKPPMQKPPKSARGMKTIYNSA